MSGGTRGPRTGCLGGHCARGDRQHWGCEDSMEMQNNSYEIIKDLSILEEESSIALPHEKLYLCKDTSNIIIIKLYFWIIWYTIIPLHKELGPGQVFQISMVAQDQHNFNMSGIEVFSDPIGRSYPLSWDWYNYSYYIIMSEFCISPACYINNYELENGRVMVFLICMN